MALIGNAAEVYPEIVRRGIVPDVVTDQTSAHDLVYGYMPPGMTLDEVAALRERNPEAADGAESSTSIAAQVEAMLAFQEARGGGIRQRQPHPHQATRGGVARTPSTSRSSPRLSSGRCSAGASAPSAG